ncbi:hypothetical protein AXG93_3304s1000 [Marchantia polymorpha subsp. ruderalis]|uniref:Reverse transcriptase domain-containing protein n=1 Tax=Marchantia polymorpha subsp. ruderalis TaxID=1480154 RepID=A0A176VHW1_MARPO|nr:hypothetical protein AXG93_3304s1000 [Marchantia polymorpha subsp. ruderalis]
MQVSSADCINQLTLWSGCRHGKQADITQKPRKKQHMQCAKGLCNCRHQGHTAVECNQPRAVRAQVQFVTPPPKEDAQVNQVELSSAEKDKENEWPDEETMVGRVETRSASRKKEVTSEKVKQDKKEVKRKELKSKDVPPKTSVSLVKKEETSAKKGKSAEELRTSSQDDSQFDGPALRLLRKAYALDIKDEVGELLREALDKTPSQKEKGKETLTAKALAQAERDFKKQNAATKKDRHPLPFTDAILDHVARHECYSFLDGFSGYNQVSIRERNKNKTTFTTDWRTYAYHKMPFGLYNAPATF